jgi:hypothetical protein
MIYRLTSPSVDTVPTRWKGENTTGSGSLYFQGPGADEQSVQVLRTRQLAACDMTDHRQPAHFFDRISDVFLLGIIYFMQAHLPVGFNSLASALLQVYSPLLATCSWL